MRGLQEKLDLSESGAIGEEANVWHHDVRSTQLVEPVQHTFTIITGLVDRGRSCSPFILKALELAL